MNYNRQLLNEIDFFEMINQPAHYTAGFPIGIIAIDLVYPKLPGNVVNASTYPFPVLYEKVSFEIEELFRGDKQIEEQIISAAKKLEQEGVRAIIGACGFFAHFQNSVKAAVNVPVYLSSLCQIPVIKTGLKADQKIAVIAYDWFDDPAKQYMAEKILAVNAFDHTAHLRVRDKERFEELVARHDRVMDYYNTHKEEIEQQYAEAGKTLKTETFWRKYLNMPPLDGDQE